MGEVDINNYRNLNQLIKWVEKHFLGVFHHRKSCLVLFSVDRSEIFFSTLHLQISIKVSVYIYIYYCRQQIQHGASYFAQSFLLVVVSEQYLKSYFVSVNCKFWSILTSDVHAVSLCYPICQKSAKTVGKLLTLLHQTNMDLED